MIKTIISNTAEDMDKKVNSFMTERRQNLPVRTECFVLGNEVMHKATIFYDTDFRQNNQTQNIDEEIVEEMHQEEYQDKKKSEKLGALWLQKDNSITGNFKESKISIPEKVIEKIKSAKFSKVVDLTIKGEQVIIMSNKFKKDNPKSPDWVIFPKKQ